MQVCALVSGGKDSIFNVHICHELKHKIVCLANLHPVETGESDSYMYQTIGTDVVPRIAEAMGLPLVRRAIRGQPLQTTGMSYSETDGDEVEDLYKLLLDMKARFPEVTAIACGAIFSDYQRLRVESVASRLGLVVLAYMWRLPQDFLLQQMIDTEIRGVLVKVASMGLDERHVGKSIQELQPYFRKLHKQFGFHVAGEGGEYETITLDAPLYDRPIEINSQVAAHGGDVWYLSDITTSLGPVRPRPTFSLPEFEGPIYDDLEALPIADTAARVVEVRPAVAASRGAQLLRGATFASTSSLDCFTFGITEQEPMAQADALLSAIVDWLATEQLSLRDVAAVDLLVADMANFAGVNEVYKRHFPAKDPPIRACVQCPLPLECHLRLRLLLRTSGTSEVLHVQSISTWAMACIGPYAQAHRVGDRLLTAGVLGLVPHSMSFNGGIQEQAKFTFRSLRHVVTVMGGSFDQVVAATIWMKAGHVDCTAVVEAVKRYLEDEGAEDVVLCPVEVPGLPKDGLVEVALALSDAPSVWVAEGSLESAAAAALARAPGCAVQVFHQADIPEAAILERWNSDIPLHLCPVVSTASEFPVRFMGMLL